MIYLDNTLSCKMSTINSVIVVGSCMIDFISYAERLPKEGETIHGTKFVTTFGGKGANQCVAAAKLGSRTALIARVGDDVWGEKYIKNLQDLNIDTNFVQITPGFTSGIAQINVSDSGANQIVIVAAANTQLSTGDVEKAQESISNAKVVVCQLETSPDVAIRAIELCRGISILNGAPAVANCNQKLLTLPSIFCVNESEAAVFTDMTVDSVEDAKKAVAVLLEKGCNIVMLTLGSQGCIVASKDSPVPQHVPSYLVECVDSTGAGDAFIGALAHLLAVQKDISLIECIKTASYVASNSVTRPGTQISFPEAAILEEYLKNV